MVILCVRVIIEAIFQDEEAKVHCELICEFAQHETCVKFG